MKTLGKILLSTGISLIFSSVLQAHSGRATAVVSELANYHEVLLENPDRTIDTARLLALLKAGGDSNRQTAIFRQAAPLAERLGAARTRSERLAAYADLVNALRPVVGRHDESGASLFYCPMAARYWIARGSAVRNPYLPNMRTCGERNAGN